MRVNQLLVVPVLALAVATLAQTPAQLHPLALAAPHAAHAFSWRGTHSAAPHGPADPFWSLGSVYRPRARTDAVRPPHSRRSRFGRGRSSCRSAPEHDSVRMRTAGPTLPLARRAHMDGVRDFCYKAPACVHDTVRRHGAEPGLAVRSAPCLPFRQVVPRHLHPRTPHARGEPGINSI